MPDLPRIVFGGDRDISVRVLRFLLKGNFRPLALLVADEKKATHAGELVKLCPHLDNSRLLSGAEFRREAGIKLLKDLAPDYIICVHFPYVFPPEVLSIPKYGALNLHPAYLPWNRGWHTPTWAIWEEMPYGATLHFMNEEVDTGDIVYQKRMRVRPDDTADSLYRRVLKLEYEAFKEAWPSIVNGTYTRKPQTSNEGSYHRKEDIKSIQRLDLRAVSKTADVIRRLRALTTSDIEEAAYFESDDKKYRVQIKFTREKFQ
jgi:methionyl-tRNA formyltransferase